MSFSSATLTSTPKFAINKKIGLGRGARAQPLQIRVNLHWASELQGSCRGARPGPANPRVWAADESLAWPARRLAWLGKTERRRIPAAVRPLLAVALRAPHTSPRSDQLGREHGGVTV